MSGRSSWLSFVPFEVSVYLRDYAGSLDAQRFQTRPARVDSRVVYDVWHGDNRDTRVGT